ncbi:hypothetical protein ACQP1P_38125 [Dactylosporangium sp. CA-052675]|uniref:hypothetical protein n=1 Tax=Dactylosporangium sp. CA-052675 TaxID=3239927 RepID=UPI003D8E7652
MVDGGVTGDALGYFHIAHYGAAAGGSGGVFGVRVEGFARQNTKDRPFGVANDFVASRLGAAIGLPVPPGSLIRIGGNAAAYLSLGFGDKGDRLPPAILPKFAKESPWEACGVIAFDQWVANNDRHDENLAYSPEVGTAVFDHDLALLGASSDPIKFLTSGMDVEIKGHKLCSLVETVDSMEHWARRISSVHPREIRTAVRAILMAGLVNKATADLLCQFLEYRKSRIREFLVRTEHEYTKVASWPFKLGEASDVS